MSGESTVKLPAALPRGSVLLHIGPPKTGTSALQGARHTQRVALARAGVHYAGRGVQPSTAAFAVTEREHPSTGRPPSMRHWNSLVREVAGHRNECYMGALTLRCSLFSFRDRRQRGVACNLGGRSCVY